VLAWITTVYAVIAVGINVITGSTAERAIWRREPGGPLGRDLPMITTS
jgi:hypothetical protein